MTGYDYPVSDEDLVKKFQEAVARLKGEGKNVRVALFDTIVSLPGVRVPFERLVEVCREEGVLSCIDGAHGVGHIPLDLGKLNPDFFVSNCHKYDPRFLPPSESSIQRSKANDRLFVKDGSTLRAAAPSSTSQSATSI